MREELKAIDDEQDEIHEAWATEAASIGEYNRLWEAYLDELELQAQAKQDSGQPTVKVGDEPPLFTVAWKVAPETRWNYFETQDFTAFWEKYLELHQKYVNRLLYELLIKQEV